MRIGILCILALLQGGAFAAGPLQRAAALYHQGRYDSALAELEAVRAQGPMKRRDSLSLYQYSGMASARLGREAEAAAHFDGLLGVDSLFQFPRNEDPQVREAFGRARRERQARLSMPAPEPAPVPAPAQIPAAAPPAPRPDPAPFAFADSGSGAPPRPAAEPERPRPPAIGLAMGAVPLGGGWLARHRLKHGLALAFLQAGGVGLSLYASGRISSAEDDPFGIVDQPERAAVLKWQWVQGVSLSTAIGAYLFSLIAATGE